MIQVNELIINRYFELNGLIVKAIDFEGLNSLYNDIKNLKPISLTEEWLLKFGFEKGNDFYGDCFYIETEKEDFVLHPEKDYFYFLYDLVEVKYVNQLQNLYFALTNEELTLKP